MHVLLPRIKPQETGDLGLGVSAQLFHRETEFPGGLSFVQICTFPFYEICLHICRDWEKFWRFKTEVVLMSSGGSMVLRSRYEDWEREILQPLPVARGRNKAENGRLGHCSVYTSSLVSRFHLE